MTAAATLTETAPTDPWTIDLAALQARYPKVREPILAAMLAITQNPGAEIDDLKKIAAEHGVRITAASVAAAERLHSRQDDQVAVPTTPELAAKTAARRPRPAAPAAPVDAEALIRQVADKIQAAGSLEADRLRGAIRKAIELLQAAGG
jgi:hypothetical protein